MKKFPKALGLEKREVTILNHLYGVELATVTAISEAAGIPRTTTHFLLMKLLERGLVKKEKVRGHYEWTFNSEAMDSFGVAPESEVDVQFGLSNFKRVYKQLANLSQGGRILAFQGNQSAQAALTKLSGEFLSKLHTSIKKQKIVIEGIMGDGTFDLFEELDSDSLRSHWGRATIVHVVPDEYVSFDADIFSVKDRLYMFNFEKEIAITITNPAITSAFHSLLSFMFENSRRIDLNEHIKSVLSARGE
jgi:predicted transcriptional regulator